MAIKGLKQTDWALLSKFDSETKQIDLGNRMIVEDPESVLRLEKYKLIDTKGVLSTMGLQYAERILERVGELKKGVPFEKRKASDPHKATGRGTLWLTGTLKKKHYMTDGALFILGKLGNQTKAEVRQGSSNLRQVIPRSVNQSISVKDVIPVFPHTWMMSGLGELDLIWMVNEEEDTFVPIQSKYYDMVVSKFPSVKFFTVKGSSEDVVQARVEKHGLKNNVVAVIMPMDLGGTMPIPKKRGSNEEEKV